MSRHDDPLTEIASATEEFLEEVRNRSDETPEKIIEEFGNRYPQIRNNIEELFPALIGIEKVAHGRRQARNIEQESLPEFEDYQIIREIGRGGMGVVYEARQRSLDRRVALKTLSLNPESNPAFLERFEREARTAASLHHTNIVPVFEVGYENGIHFFSMQYIDGINLSDLCRHLSESRQMSQNDSMGKNRSEIATGQLNSMATRTFAAGNELPYLNPKSPLVDDPFAKVLGELGHQEIARIGAQIADALHYIHSQGIVHRDIKPSNILLDETGTPWLADWGLVRSEISELTQTGDLFGSLPYMAPERFSGQARATSDIYSLGATLYELVTLRRIFDVQDQLALVATIVNENPKKPSEFAPNLSRDFENVILKAIDKQEDSRYQSSYQFAQDLRNLFEGRAVSARRLTTFEKFGRWCRNQPVIAALSGLFVLTLVAGIVVSSMFAVQANHSSELAQLGQRQSEESLDVFFGTFFPQASPDVDAKMAPDVREMMDKAVASIMSDDSYDPIVVGKLFNKLGWIYFNQQDYEQAFKVFNHSQTRIAGTRGEDHPVALKALDHVGMTLMRLEDYHQAEQALLKAWKLQARELGPEHENTIHSYAKLGDLYLYMGKFDECIEITKEVLEIRQRPRRPDSAFATVSMNGLANAYIQEERFQEAIDLLEHVIETHEANRRINLGFSVNLHNLARAYRHIHRLQEAQRLNDRSLTIRRDALGEQADSLLGGRTLEAGLLTDMGKPEQALPLLNKLWEDARETELHIRKAMIRLERGRCLKRLARESEAIEDLSYAWSTLRRFRTEKNLYTRMARQALNDLEGF